MTVPGAGADGRGGASTGDGDVVDPPPPTGAPPTRVPPTREERRRAAAAAGWQPVRAGDLAGVAWTLAADGVPVRARGVLRGALTAWCWPARLLTIGRNRYHRDDRRTTVSLSRTVPPGVAIAIGAAVWLLFRPAVRGLPPTAVFVVAGVFYGYLLTLGVLQWLRDRAERTAAERRGLFRIAPQIRTTWWLGRVAVRDPGADRAAALAAAVTLCRLVVAPGETVGAVAASDRQQAELEAAGFREPRGSKGMVILDGGG